MTNNLNGADLFAYCGNNPINRIDPLGRAWWHWALGAAIVVGCGVATVVTCGGFAAAAAAVCSVAGGCAAATTAATVSAGAFIGSSAVLGASAAISALESSSVQDFNKKGNWGTVAGTAGGAVLGGAGAYFGLTSPGSSGSTKQIETGSKITNDIIDLPRVGSALKTDSYHAFPNIVDNYAGLAKMSPVNNGILYQLEGSLNGKIGRFEWIVENQQVVHRMFVEGGEINGIPIMP